MLHPLTKPEQDRAFFCCNRYGLSGHGSEQPIDLHLIICPRIAFVFESSVRFMRT